ncbi:MAG: prepilin-type N-terminal cleavage/methylation domain-containing protein [Rhodocyclaceae bacterium]|nr:prepilin-type N-terminal cleavage/methylation domain-containing protein [Rhodocyclaceae bacterium]
MSVRTAAHCAAVFHRTGKGGFSLVELVAVMAIAAILAVVALPRFTDRGAFDVRGYSDRLAAATRHARAQAIASRRKVCVFFAASGSFAPGIYAAAAPGAATACTVNVLDPASGAPYRFIAPAGTSFGATAAEVDFDALGRPVLPGVAVSVSVTGGGDTRQFVIEPDTGHVHP